MNIYYKGDFKDTDIARNLKECFAPHSAYLYVENLWYRNKEMVKKLNRISEEQDNHIEIMKEILGE